MNSVLHFHGPYGLTPTGGWPSLSTPVAAEHGIYLWTVELPDRYRVAYVGKTDGRGGFKVRLAVEVERYLRQLPGDNCYDVALFRQGERKLISPDHVALQGGIDWSPVFIAPISCDAHRLLLIESAIIRRLRSYSPGTRSFLVNRHCRKTRLPEPLEITSPDGIVLEGLEEPVQ